MEPAATLPLPPALLLVRARSRASRVADLGDAAAACPPDTPPRLSPVTVPFLWEEAPGKPKAAAPGPALPAEGGGKGDHDKGRAEARPAPPLRLPPRLQRVAPPPDASSRLSPTAVLQGPYYGCAGGGDKRPMRDGNRAAVFRRTPSAGAALFSRARSKLAAAAAPGSGKSKGGGFEPDAAPWGSPAGSSSSSSSSSYFGDDHGHRRPGEAQHKECSEKEDDSDSAAARGSVRITRFRRNRSLPSIVNTSHLWASLRRSVKHITPWS
ncbi:hypothetical protein BS78_03G162900 [Paspalum vaginatum]|nr:hypothetical protein BS78_03G162900 [Paspalum vaginatum]